MINIFLELAAASYLLFLGCIVSATGTGATIIYKVLPIALSLGLGMFGIAQLMHWPI